MNLILLAFIVSTGINLLMFIPAFIYKTDKLTDISYSITFATLAIFGFYRSTQNSLHSLILILVLMWALRLGSFLFIRINKIGKDVRFDGMREHFLLFLRFWILQAATVFVVLLPVLMGYEQENADISTLSWFGVGVFIAGLTIEAIADAQKFRFNSNPRNKGLWIDVGVWRASRHPNYLGEMMVWTGMYLIVASSLSRVGLFTAALSPVYIISLLLFVSGIPLLEKSAKKKWGGQESFRRYLTAAPVLIPTIRSIKRIYQKP